MLIEFTHHLSGPPRRAPGDRIVTDEAALKSMGVPADAYRIIDVPTASPRPRKSPPPTTPETTPPEAPAPEIPGVEDREVAAPPEHREIKKIKRTRNRNPRS